MRVVGGYLLAFFAMLLIWGLFVGLGGQVLAWIPTEVASANGSTGIPAVMGGHAGIGVSARFTETHSGHVTIE